MRKGDAREDTGSNERGRSGALFESPHRNDLADRPAPGLEDRPRVAIPEKPARRTARRATYGLRKDARGIWHCDFKAAGRRIARSTKTVERAAAEQLCSEWSQQAWREKNLGETPKVTWLQACRDWIVFGEKTNKRSLTDDYDKARILSDTRLASRFLHELRASDIDRVLDDLQEQRGFGNATRNRYYAFLSAAWRYARQLRPGLPEFPRLDRLKERDRPLRYLLKEEWKRLSHALPPYLERPARFTLLTGLRRHNVMNLRWSQIDLSRQRIIIPASEMKADKEFICHLSDEAIELLLNIRSTDPHDEHVFLNSIGQPLRHPTEKCWHDALRAAGIENFRWHDLRRTWAAWHAMNGTPLPVLQQLGGWATIKMVMVYAKLAPEHTAGFANNVRL